jgi:hypothetical protein
MRAPFSRSLAIGMTTALALAGAASSATGQGLSGFSDYLGGHVFYVGADFHVHQLYFSNANTWSNQDLTVAAQGINASNLDQLVSFADGSGEHVFYTGTDLHVHRLSIYNSPWQDLDLTNASGSGTLANDALTGFSDAVGEHVYYAGARDGHIHELLLNGSTWSDRDLSAWTNTAGPGIGNHELTSFSDGHGEHLLYVGLDSHVHQIHQQFHCGHIICFVSWVDQDLTVAARSTTLAAVTSTSFSDANGEHVFYADAPAATGASHIHQLVSTDGTTWADQDLTAFRGYPPTYYPDMTSFSDRWGEHLFYEGADQDVHQLYNGLISWWDQDLTQLARNTAPGSNPVAINGCFVGASYADAGGEHLFYFGNDNDVHELLLADFTSSPWVDENLTSMTVGVGPLRYCHLP